MAKYTLLIADDEEIECKALRLLVQKELPEIEVVGVARNGVELVSMAQKLRPDIATVDVNMPGMSGIDAIGLLSSCDLPTRFVICTAYDEFEYVHRSKYDFAGICSFNVCTVWGTYINAGVENLSFKDRVDS